MSEQNEKFKKVAEYVKKVQHKNYTLSLSSEETTVTDSKVGGHPYIAKGDTIPTVLDSETELRFLAQINLEQLTGDIFPLKTGILQFWILDEDVYGADFDEPCSQENFRVTYHKTIEEGYSKEEVEEHFPSLFADVEDGLPIEPDVCFKITATEDISTITMGDFHFDSLFVEKYNEWYPEEAVTAFYDITADLDDDIFDELYMEEAGHKLLGFPDFTQSDPREFKQPEYILLFQLDSDDVGDEEILWGDCGIGNWFIHPDDLKNGDFSKVMYNWDCS